MFGIYPPPQSTFATDLNDIIHAASLLGDPFPFIGGRHKNMFPLSACLAKTHSIAIGRLSGAAAMTDRGGTATYHLISSHLSGVKSSRAG